MAAPDTAGEPAVLERVIETKVTVASTKAVSNPPAVPMDVRRVRMSRTVAERWVISVRFRPAAVRAGTMGWDESTAEHAATATVKGATVRDLCMTATGPLRERGGHIHEQRDE
jgi:hypothetical protein